MIKKNYTLSIDQGTSGTKVLIVDQNGQTVVKSSVSLNSIFPKRGWVEQEPEEIFENVLTSTQKGLREFSQMGFKLNSIKSCGISNQRETFIVWNKEGVPFYHAVVWQCKRSVEICKRLEEDGFGALIREKTGLMIDPYFSGTKIIWLVENNTEIKAAINSGEAFFGTVDTWLLYKLTEGREYSTDYTNASRTLLFNIHTLKWDEEIIEKFGLTGINLPKVQASSSYFGESNFGGFLERKLPITAMIGDSHAAAFGEECFSPGTAKATLGTGCSVLMNTGEDLKKSHHGMVSTICWSTEDRIDYGLEGVIVTCGATIEWLKNKLGIIAHHKETEDLAASLDDNGGVYLLPAFSGMGAPYWDMSRKASIVGLSFDSDKRHVVRAALESIPYQIKDVVSAMEADAGMDLKEINIDGGISTNSFVANLLSNLLVKPVIRMDNCDVSALGAGYLAGLKSGVFSSIDQIKDLQKKQTLLPEQKSIEEVAENYQEWKRYLKAD